MHQQIGRAVLHPQIASERKRRKPFLVDGEVKQSLEQDAALEFMPMEGGSTGHRERAEAVLAAPLQPRTTEIMLVANAAVWTYLMIF